jgi:MFS family permease
MVASASASLIDATRGAAPARFGRLRHIALASFYFGLSFTWLPYPAVLLQSQIRHFFGNPNEQVAMIGYTTAAGAVFAVLVPPLVGAFSDRLTTPWGRRRPLVVAGMLMSLVGIVLMWTAQSYPQLLVGHLVTQIFLNGSAAAYYAIIPDVVPEPEFGKASGFLAVMTLGGGLVGFAMTGVLSGLHRVLLSYPVMAIVLALSVLPVLWAGSQEGRRPIHASPRRSARQVAVDFLQPLWAGDFAWVIFTRTMVSAGVAAVFYFLSPFFQHVVGVSNPDQFTSYWLLVAFASTLLPGLLGGAASDRYGRKPFVYAAGALQILVAVYFIAFYPTQTWVVLLLGAVYGIGYGLYVAVDWALACDTIPDRAKSAKDMGLFHVGQTLPSAVIPAVEGPLIAHFNEQAANSGYRVAFASVIVFFVLGTVFVSRIRSGSRPRDAAVSPESVGSPS